MTSRFRILLMLLAVSTAVGSAATWLLPREVMESWIQQQADESDFAQYAAREQARALWFVLRILLPLLGILSAIAVWKCEKLARFATDVLSSLKSSTLQTTGAAKSLRTWTFRCMLFAWFSMAAFHYAHSNWVRIRDWPWYHLNDGPQILPNISDSNRDVIRFLKETTPEDSRILVLSDQKLFFFSYYLLPRQLFHPVHPDSEFVIPAPNQQRQLTAYQRSDLDEDDIERLAPDYILEYFEGSRYVEPDRALEDADWIAYQQVGYGPAYVPEFNVRLTPYETKSVRQEGGDK